MSWNKNTIFNVILTAKATIPIQNFLDYIFYESKNAQAAYSVDQDMYVIGVYHDKQDYENALK